MLCFAHIVDGSPATIDVADQRDLIAKKDQWDKPTEEMMGTTNHGKGSRSKPFDGFLLPRKLFWDVL
jgi:hypothetical protein